jgi:hypothetical protein
LDTEVKEEPADMYPIKEISTDDTDAEMNITKQKENNLKANSELKRFSWVNLPA